MDPPLILIIMFLPFEFITTPIADIFFGLSLFKWLVIQLTLIFYLYVKYTNSQTFPLICITGTILLYEKNFIFND